MNFSKPTSGESSIICGVQKSSVQIFELETEFNRGNDLPFCVVSAGQEGKGENHQLKVVFGCFRDIFHRAAHPKALVLAFPEYQWVLLSFLLTYQ